MMLFGICNVYKLNKHILSIIFSSKKSIYLRNYGLICNDYRFGKALRDFISFEPQNLDFFSNPLHLSNMITAAMYL